MIVKASFNHTDLFVEVGSAPVVQHSFGGFKVCVSAFMFIEQSKYSPIVDWTSDVMQQDPFLVSASSLTDSFL